MKLSYYAYKHYYDDCLNCAQAVFLAVSDKYNLGYTIADTKIMSGFGGGMASGEACGALTGGVAGLGVLILKDSETGSPLLHDMTVEFVKQFKEYFSSVNCCDISPSYKKERPDGCVKTVVLASEILDKILEDIDC